MNNVIDSFRGEYNFLSNFYKVDITIDGITYPSSENAYQALKYDDIDVRKQIALLSPKGAKEYSGLHKAPADNVNQYRLYRNMFRILMCKFFGNCDLMRKLLTTGNAELIEGNTWGDTYWGVCEGKGENNLGKILMDIRDMIEDTI